MLSRWIESTDSVNSVPSDSWYMRGILFIVTWALVHYFYDGNILSRLLICSWDTLNYNIFKAWILLDKPTVPILCVTCRSISCIGALHASVANFSYTIVFGAVRWYENDGPSYRISDMYVVLGCTMQHCCSRRFELNGLCSSRRKSRGTGYTCDWKLNGGSV